MNRKDLEKLGLEKEVIDTILDSYHGAVGKIELERDNAIKDLETTKTELAQRTTDLTELQKTANLSDEQKQQFDALAKKYDDESKVWEAKLLENKKLSAVEIAIAKAQVNDDVAIKAHLNEFIANAELDDKGFIKGLDEQLTNLKTERAYLFEESGAGGIKQKLPPSGNEALQAEVNKFMGIK